MCSLHPVSKRQLCWIESFPPVALPAVELGPIFAWFPAFGRRYLYRDLDGRCKRLWIVGPRSSSIVMPRWLKSVYVKEWM